MWNSPHEHPHALRYTQTARQETQTTPRALCSFAHFIFSSFLLSIVLCCRCICRLLLSFFRFSKITSRLCTVLHTQSTFVVPTLNAQTNIMICLCIGNASHILKEMAKLASHGHVSVCVCDTQLGSAPNATQIKIKINKPTKRCHSIWKFNCSASAGRSWKNDTDKAAINSAITITHGQAGLCNKDSQNDQNLKREKENTWCALCNVHTSLAWPNVC